MRDIENMLWNGIPRVIVSDRDVDGFAGEIQMPHWKGSIVVSWGCGWEHVSVAPYRHSITPSWEDMCYIKNLFWDEEECVVEYHPKKSQYVNNMPNCLHLWKPDGHDVEMPPSVLVDIRKGQTRPEYEREINKLYEEYEHGGKTNARTK